MTEMNFAKKILNGSIEKISQCAKFYMAEPGKFLMYTGAIGWLGSAAAQVIAILKNDTIPSKEKKFLIPQEIVDCAVNLTILLTVASQFEKFGKNLVDNGKILTSGLKHQAENVLKHKDALLSNKNASDYKKVVEKIFEKSDDQHSFMTFRKGVGACTNLIGQIIAVNILTPIVRNKLGAYYQKRTIAKEKSSASMNEVKTVGNQFNGSVRPKPAMNMTEYLNMTRNMSLNTKVGL